MKSYSSVLITLSLIILGAHAVAQSTEAKQENPNAPEITFSTPIHDYGTIKVGSDGTCLFTFKNTGKEPLILSGAHSSCGCTVPTWPREPIMPGQGGTIKVVYDTKRLGIINKSVNVSSNAKNSMVTLYIKGNVIQ